MIERFDGFERVEEQAKKYDEGLHSQFRRFDGAPPESEQTVSRPEVEPFGASDNLAGTSSDGADDSLDMAAERLKGIEGLKPETWREMDIHGRQATLNAAGQELADVYDHPAPPLLIREMPNPGSYGSYGDGYRFDSLKGRVEGADYGIQMNESGGVDYEKLFGDDPRVALETYAHEFRHSYQYEQVNRWEKPQFHNLVDNFDASQEWAENLRDYKRPQDGFDAYFNQPVERDARAFAQQVVGRVYR